jgi:hypothetical protein
MRREHYQEKTTKSLLDASNCLISPSMCQHVIMKMEKV